MVLFRRYTCVNLSIFEFPASSNFKFLPRVEHLYAFQSIIQEQKLCARVPRTIPRCGATTEALRREPSDAVSSGRGMR